MDTSCEVGEVCPGALEVIAESFHRSISVVAGKLHLRQ
jgi:hypothetical protein